MHTVKEKEENINIILKDDKNTSLGMSLKGPLKLLCFFLPVEVPGELDLAARLAKHKQSFLNLLRHNGRRVTKVYSNLNG